jgi:superfamily II DNA/RNA helicase
VADGRTKTTPTFGNAPSVDAQRRTQLLRHLVIGSKNGPHTGVCGDETRPAEIVADKLRKTDIEAEPFHGELRSRNKRTQVLMDFKASTVRVNRRRGSQGLDIAQLPVVVSLDLPAQRLDRHRIDRTGAGWRKCR